MTIFRGLSAVNRTITAQYRALSAVNRTIKEQYRGYSAVNRKVFSTDGNTYLYNVGDECTALTGGWDTLSWRTTYTAVHTATENASDITIKCKGAGSSTGQTLYTHATAIDLTNFTTLHCKGRLSANNGDYYVIAIMTTKNSGAKSGSFTSWTGITTYVTGTAIVDTEITIDVSAYNGSYYIYMACGEGYSGGNVLTSAIFSQVWLT